MKAIEVDNVSFAYGSGKRDVLDRISLSCDKGSVNALIGLNGCGKTTLIKVMSGLEAPKSGTVWYSGRDLSSMEYRERSRALSYVKQSHSSLSDYTVRDYLLFGTLNRLDLFDSPGEGERARVEELVDEFGIRHLYGKSLGELSGGERQIVSICSAMVQDSDAVLLDEPCSALDIANQEKVLSILRTIADGGKTVFFSTHNPNHALRTDAQVLLMQSGRIIDSGAAGKVVTPERLKPIYGDRICYSRELPYEEVSFRRKTGMGPVWAPEPDFGQFFNCPIDYWLQSEPFLRCRRIISSPVSFLIISGTVSTFTTLTINRSGKARHLISRFGSQAFIQMNWNLISPKPNRNSRTGLPAYLPMIPRQSMIPMGPSADTCS